MSPVTDRLVRHGVLAVALAGMSVTGLAALSSSAVLTGSRTTPSATVASGSLSTTTSGGAAAGQWLGAVSLAPGTSAYRALTVTNTGSIPLRYAVEVESTDTVLAPRLPVDVVVISAATTCNAAAFAGSPTVVSTLGATLGSADGATPVDLIGATTTGQDPGDRLLGVSDAETLCLRVTHPTGLRLGRAAVGATAPATFTLVSESQ